MRKFAVLLFIVQFMFVLPHELISQEPSGMCEFGISAGGFTNFPASKNYLTEDLSAFYVAPYIRTGQHEFSLGILYPLNTKALMFTENNISARPGVIAGYKYYIFNVYGRENLFVHYSFQYLRFRGNYDLYYEGNTLPFKWTETDMYINNVIGLGYNLFFDMNGRFGLYYTLDYLVSQRGYNINNGSFHDDQWNTSYIWNNLSTHIGFLFKITSLKKEAKKQ